MLAFCLQIKLYYRKQKIGATVVTVQQKLEQEQVK